MAGKAFVQMPDQGRLLDMGRFQMRLWADADMTDGGFSLLEADEPPGFGPPMHVHEDADEAFYVLEGEYVIFIEDTERLCPAGSFIYIPSGVEHGFRVGRRHSRKLNFYQPAAMVGYFEELASATAVGRALTSEDLTAIASRHAVRVLGPVPEDYL